MDTFLTPHSFSQRISQIEIDVQDLEERHTGSSQELKGTDIERVLRDLHKLVEDSERYLGGIDHQRPEQLAMGEEPDAETSS